jgi:hypothetical protein
MSTWLLDTPLFNMLATPKAKPLLEWCAANRPSLFISAESLTEISAAIGKMSATGGNVATRCAYGSTRSLSTSQIASTRSTLRSPFALAGSCRTSRMLTRAIAFMMPCSSRRRSSTATA